MILNAFNNIYYKKKISYNEMYLEIRSTLSYGDLQ